MLTRSLSRPALRLSALARWLVFPALLTGVAGATLALLDADVPPPAVSAIVLLGSAALMLGLERLFPLHRQWNARPEGLDLALLAGNRLVDAAVLAATLALLGQLDRAGLAPALWPASWPLPAQALLGIALSESLRYAFHRWSHRPGWLWRIHRTHHEPRRMYALNGPRLHPGNQAWLALANTVPMLLLGAPLPALVLAANVTVLFVLLQHANLALRWDGWNQLLATPDVHRLHHQRGRARAGVNYGIVLLVFDRLFGTFEAAQGDCRADGIGLD